MAFRDCRKQPVCQRDGTDCRIDLNEYCERSSPHCYMETGIETSLRTMSTALCGSPVAMMGQSVLPFVGKAPRPSGEDVGKGSSLEERVGLRRVAVSEASI